MCIQSIDYNYMKVVIFFYLACEIDCRQTSKYQAIPIQ